MQSTHKHKEEVPDQEDCAHQFITQSQIYQLSKYWPNWKAAIFLDYKNLVKWLKLYGLEEIIKRWKKHWKMLSKLMIKFQDFKF